MIRFQVTSHLILNCARFILLALVMHVGLAMAVNAADLKGEVATDVTYLVDQLHHDEHQRRDASTKQLLTLAGDAKYISQIHQQLVRRNLEPINLESATRSAQILSNIGVNHDEYFLKTDRLFSQLIGKKVPHRSSVRALQIAMRHQRHVVLSLRFQNVEGIELVDTHMTVDESFNHDSLSLDMILQMNGLKSLTLKKRKDLKLPLIRALLAADHLQNLTLDRCPVIRGDEFATFLENSSDKEKVYVLHGAFLGIQGATYAEAFREQDQPDNWPKGGAVIHGVHAFPALGTDMKPGDIITEMDGTKVDGFEDLLRMIGKKRPGDTAKFKYFQRDTQKFEEDELKLGERP